MVIQGAEKLEGAGVGVAGVEKDDLVFPGTVVFLIPVQQVAGPEVRVDVPKSVKEHIWADEPVVNLADVLHDPAMDVLHELVAVGFLEKGRGDIIRHLLVLLEHVPEVGGPLAKRLAVHELAELLEDIEGQDVDVIAWALDALLYRGDLLAHKVLLVTWVEIKEEVIDLDEEENK